MFRNVPESSGMFHVPGFIDARYNSTFLLFLLSSVMKSVGFSFLSPCFVFFVKDQIVSFPSKQIIMFLN